MGLYLNSIKPCVIYENLAHSTYFIDKTAMLEELIPLVGQAGGVRRRMHERKAEATNISVLQGPAVLARH